MGTLDFHLLFHSLVYAKVPSNQRAMEIQADCSSGAQHNVTDAADGKDFSLYTMDADGSNKVRFMPPRLNK